MKKREAGAIPVAGDDDDFENFLLATRMRKCFYNETQNILGNTFGMCVLQVSSFVLLTTTDCCYIYDSDAVIF